MSMRINHNIASLMAQKNVNRSSAAMTQSYARLSSGLRITRAADDAAGAPLPPITTPTPPL